MAREGHRRFTDRAFFLSTARDYTFCRASIILHEDFTALIESKKVRESGYPTLKFIVSIIVDLGVVVPLKLTGASLKLQYLSCGPHKEFFVSVIKESRRIKKCAGKSGAFEGKSCTVQALTVNYLSSPARSTYFVST